MGAGQKFSPSISSINHIQIGDLAVGASVAAGIIRWNGTNFQGYDGSQWVNLDLATGDISTTLLDLTDTPGTYTDQAGKTLIVNDTPDGVEFTKTLWAESGNLVSLVDPLDSVLFYDGINIEEDCGAVTLFEKSVTASSSVGTDESYSFDMDGNVIMKIYAESDGAGSVAADYGLASPSYFYLGDPTTDPLTTHCWRMYMESSDNSLIIEKRETNGTWTEMGKFI